VYHKWGVSQMGVSQMGVSQMGCITNGVHHKWGASQMGCITNSSWVSGVPQYKFAVEDADLLKLI
jgi:hypothetical protein